MATFLADMCGTNAFTISTLEEAIVIKIYLNSGYDATIVEAAAGGGGNIRLGEGS